MASKASSLRSLYMRFKPYFVIFLTQIGYTFLYFITEASFNHGMNPHVYVTYRHLVAGILLFPFAYFLERNIRPKLTFSLILEIFILSLVGVALSLNMYFASLKYTSATFVSSVINTIAAVTFVIAITLRLETVDLRNVRGIAKVVGTLVSLAGVTIMTVYKGSIIRNVEHSHLIHIQGSTTIQEHWLIGSLLAVASCMSFSLWYIMQAFTLKRYPAQLSLTTWISFIGAAQSAFFAVTIEHKPSAWKIGFNIDFWSTVYGGVVISGLVVYAQLWCNEERGPVFVTMFNPLTTILVTVLAYFVFGEKLYMGSILGAAIIIVGLYLLLWGKEGDQVVLVKTEEQSYSSYDEKNAKMQKITSDESQMPQGEP